MSFEELKTQIEKIKVKYSNEQNNVSDYLKEIDNEFYEYGTVTENFAFEEVLNDIISGKDCEGIVMGASPNKYYHWKGKDKPRVSEVDFELLSELVDEALDITEEYYKAKVKDYDLC